MHPRSALIAQNARAMFEAMPGLRSKAFTLNERQRQAINFYIWDNEAAARAFFTPELAARIAHCTAQRRR